MATQSIYAIREASNYLGLSPKTVYEAVKKGKIPAYRIGSRLYLPLRTLKKLCRRRKYERYRLLRLRPIYRRDFLTVTEASKQLGCSRQHTYRLVKQGFLVPEIEGRNYLIAYAAIEDFKTRGRKPAKRGKERGEKDEWQRRLPHTELKPTTYVRSKALHDAGWCIGDEEAEREVRIQYQDILSFLKQKDLADAAEVLRWKFLGRENWLKARYGKPENAPAIIRSDEELIARLRIVIEDEKCDDLPMRKLVAGLVKELYGREIELPDEIDYLPGLEIDREQLDGAQAVGFHTINPSADPVREII